MNLVTCFLTLQKNMVQTPKEESVFVSV